MLTLYPDIKPYVRHTLAVEPPHQLYVEECGHPGGLPVLVLHGGPGNGCQPHQRCFFDPDLYRVILFDQRGCGRSQPHGELEKNTTTALLADMEHIRKHLGIERWLIFGGSWGATLGLLYGEAYPNRVLGLLLRGIFLGRDQDIRWFLQEGTPQIFPDAWASLVEDIPPGERNNLMEAFHRLLNSPDELAQMAAAKALNAWESSCSRLVSGKRSPPQAHPALLAQARLRIHYARNHYFIKPNQILSHAHPLANIPGVIIHGRYDVVCPVGNAWELHQAWPLSELQIVPVAGHAATEPTIVDALVRATNLMARRVG
ncbi:prolyl aminopeptidase [Nitrosococcus wardiae]|uniref:Proline iminopeptidase n=1 Tax=Nitrosococcus wardiae TaxID=1814290 RepID=A0A4P7BVH6_9GAMM|nr:prolyl aminopeptidase [Nitrosococcus wardiae]QBQ53287.1 prolyl aminopeptidase [Nitrosococcus wardiae]